MVLNDYQERKSILRSRLLRDLRLQSSQGAFQSLHGRIVEQLQHILPFGQKVAAYYPLPTEPDLTTLFLDRPFEFVFPRVAGDNLEFCKTHSNATLVCSSLGVLEPSATAEVVAKNEIAAMLIPGVGFDRQGRRLGRGKGYYDRALAAYGGLKIGVCFSCQMVNDGLPLEAHDACMDYVVTENFILKRLDS